MCACWMGWMGLMGVMGVMVSPCMCCAGMLLVMRLATSRSTQSDSTCNRSHLLLCPFSNLVLALVCEYRGRQATYQTCPHAGHGILGHLAKETSFCLSGLSRYWSWRISGDGWRRRESRLAIAGVCWVIWRNIGARVGRVGCW